VVCNRPYNCGSLINIPYPFWEDSRPQSCGQHGYNLSCRNNDYPVLRFEELEFRVLNINRANGTFTIARSDLWEGPCALTPEFHNTTLNFTLFDYASTVQDITLLYGCPPQENIPPAPNRFNCSQIGLSDGKNNAYIVDESPLGIQYLPQLLLECNHSIKVPILRTSARALLEDPQGGAPEVVLQKAMNQGFDVEYSYELATSCTSCEVSGGVCGSNARQPLVCYCRDQVQSSSPCPTPGMHALFSSHFLNWMAFTEPYLFIQFGRPRK